MGGGGIVTSGRVVVIVMGVQATCLLACCSNPAAIATGGAPEGCLPCGATCLTCFTTDIDWAFPWFLDMRRFFAGPAAILLKSGLTDGIVLGLEVAANSSFCGLL